MCYTLFLFSASRTRPYRIENNKQWPNVSEQASTNIIRVGNECLQLVNANDFLRHYEMDQYGITHTCLGL